MSGAVYSRWDGTQEPELTDDALIEALVAHLLAGDPLADALKLLVDESADGAGALFDSVDDASDGSMGWLALEDGEASIELLAAAAAGGWFRGDSPVRVANRQSADETLERSRLLVRRLLGSGALRLKEGQLVPGPALLRRVGLAALRELFRDLAASRPGEHDARGLGGTLDAPEESRPYVFGDPFIVDLAATLGASLRRPAVPLTLSPDDVHVFRPAGAASCATVLLLDLSASMVTRGHLPSARRLGLALHTLIATKYPRDTLTIVGFADRARTLTFLEVVGLDASSAADGTNLQDGLALARRVLRRHRGSTRQVLLVTDGEPTAHREGVAVRFSYPPSFHTIRETLLEVARCTREGVTISTFMLEGSRPLVDFVTRMARVNRGRVFIADSQHLGRYALADFLRHRQGIVG